MPLTQANPAPRDPRRVVTRVATAHAVAPAPCPQRALCPQRARK